MGTYDQIKINYGACTLVNSGLEQLLNLDPSIQSGDSIAFGFQIVQGQQVQLTFDFNAYESVYENGESYFFKPVIRVQNTLLSGWILGSVVRPDTLPVTVDRAHIHRCGFRYDAVRSKRFISIVGLAGKHIFSHNPLGRSEIE